MIGRKSEIPKNSINSLGLNHSQSESETERKRGQAFHKTRPSIQQQGSQIIMDETFLQKLHFRLNNVDLIKEEILETLESVNDVGIINNQSESYLENNYEKVLEKRKGRERVKEDQYMKDMLDVKNCTIVKKKKIQKPKFH